MKVGVCMNICDVHRDVSEHVCDVCTYIIEHVHLCAH